MTTCYQQARVAIIYGEFLFYRMVLHGEAASTKVEYWRLLWGIELTSLEISPSLEEIILYQSCLAFSMNWAF